MRRKGIEETKNGKAEKKIFLVCFLKNEGKVAENKKPLKLENIFIWLPMTLG